MLVDTHAHLDDSMFDNDRDEMLQAAEQVGMSAIINVGVDVHSSKMSVTLAEKYSIIWATIGLHPHDAKMLNNQIWQEFVRLTKCNKVIAIGEIGLDYYRMLSPKDIQHAVFRQFIGLAREIKLPIIVHSRDAHEDTLQILKEEKADEIGGVLHAFSGDKNILYTGLELGFYISLCGTITFSNSKLKYLIKDIPLERLLLETDCPYLTPYPYRGKRNQPVYVKYVAEKVAMLLDMDTEEIIRINKDNAYRLFQLDKFK
jgi:TatD DNase family protein